MDQFGYAVRLANFRINALVLCISGITIFFQYLQNLIIMAANNRITPMEQHLPETMKILFGEGIVHHCILVVTHCEKFRERSDYDSWLLNGVTQSPAFNGNTLLIL